MQAAADWERNETKQREALTGFSFILTLQASQGDIPHLLFYGPSGAGKKTRVMALLREIFGPGVDKVKLEHRTFQTPTKRKIELTTLGSNYHIEMSPSDAGNDDRYVVQEVIKEIAQYHPVVVQGGFAAQEGTNPFKSSSSSSSSSAMPVKKGSSKGNFKVVFLSDCDYLTKEAQHGLRRTMEKYVRTCRLILCCENLSKVIDPLRSRCLPIRVPAPKFEEIATIIQTVSKRETGSEMNDAVVSMIARASKRNLRRALLMAEAQKVSGNQTEKVPLPDWEEYIGLLARKISVKQTPETLLEAREMLYSLLQNCIPAPIIFKALVSELLKKADDSIKIDALKWAAHYERRLHSGQKDIYHLEAFVAKYMLIYSEYIKANFM